ncbi:hypothetical protein [Ekhidna sp.]
MKPQELRIGNWVYRKGDNENMYEADWITIKEAHNYRPIPITEEWLEKFGLVIEDIASLSDCFHWQIDERWKVFIATDYGNKGLALFLGDEAPIFSAKCEYIHQLQNLYYALTGEELKMKE